MDTFKNGDYDIIHFSTHGKHNADAPVISEIDLGNGYYLKPNAINGRATNFGKSHPLVILNACESGKLDFSFTAVQGWATQFLEAGASAFICTL
jgi:CHAT domain-containing protein